MGVRVGLADRCYRCYAFPNSYTHCMLMPSHDAALVLPTFARRGRRDIGGLCGKHTCTAVGHFNVIDVVDRLHRLLCSNLSRRHMFCSAAVSFLETAP